MDIRIEGGSALIDGRFVNTAINVNGDDGTIVGIDGEARSQRAASTPTASWCFPASSISTATRSSAR